MQTTDTTKYLLRRFHALLGQKGLRDQKDAILEGMGVSSAKDLSDNELAALIESLAQKPDYKPLPKAAVPQSLRDARSAVLKCLGELGVQAINNDWSHVNDYLKQPRIAGKVLYECTEAELKALIPKLKAIAAKRRMQISEENRLAANN